MIRHTTGQPPERERVCPHGSGRERDPSRTWRRKLRTAHAPPPASGQMARFIDELFDSLPDSFSGVLRVTSSAEVAIVGLRLRVNGNDELKMTTTSPSNEMDPSTSEDRFFAHLVDSWGWSTQFILFSGVAGQAASGTLRFIDTSGQPLDLTQTQP